MSRFSLHRTAISRTRLSRPVRLALASGLLSQGDTFMDYGCGRGGDVRRLNKHNIDAVGWDPVFRPKGPQRRSAVVNLGFVLNVIDDPRERIRALQQAWALAEEVLLVAVLTPSDLAAGAVPVGDGVVSSHGTFQKAFEQRECEQMLRDVLDVEPVALDLGVFATIRDASRRAEFLASRFRRRTRMVDANKARAVFAENAEALACLVQFVETRGRFPRRSEASDVQPAVDRFGTLARANALVRSVVPPADLANAAEKVRDDLLVFLALTRFGGRPRMSELRPGTQFDVKAHFGSYAAATRTADELLFSLRDPTTLARAHRGLPVGKTLPTFFYIHRSAVDQLPAVLRLYEGCARKYLGGVEGANLVKLGLRDRSVSYLSYPTFDRAPHPPLQRSLSVDLQTFRVRTVDYSARENPPILHRKELFVAADYPGRDKFQRLTQQEERFSLYDGSTGPIGTQRDWERRLTAANVQLRGHRVVRTQP